MNLHSQGAQVHADNALDPAAGAARLRRGLQNPSREAIADVAQQFESLFVQMMLKQMRTTTPGNDLFGSQAEDQYRDVLDQQLAMNMAATGQGLGLAEAVERQMLQHAGLDEGTGQGAPKDLADYRREAIPARATPWARARPADTGAEGGDGRPAVKPVLDGLKMPAFDRPVAPKAGAAEPEGASDSASTAADNGQSAGGPPWDSPAEFVEGLLPAARETAAELGVSPRALIAQAALETGWGQHVIDRGEQGSSHNLFNIKSHGWAGDSVSVATLEYREGVAQREQASFRAYGGVAESFRDYADFLRRNPRYSEALAVGHDPSAFVHALQDAGYATDPRYAEKLERVMNSEHLRHVDDTPLRLADGGGRTSG
ncbi:flagellar assembly peptidoglycan hydrolase FlgJ [Alkalilimnicola ehrlichii MLHE-1]|uniref:Peptidoglycan hydrolase FlgJ n=1 Tax=Alkalilimnicola ehrlichii (strain ATCC BAA-1101 / DSM 17681 / MLHE-1) TaxID=187272 RepID=Q0AA82_ALKEH|nr:flagellar assembly peptidoglycan hydrolase FlgJ [Alkalilimnicola ehrlichii]ABI56255.1 flagellar rod assembly protein/muramidase FlgJ [Alkalilimnicola ehrlichii MLHE-1]